jgi:hypothetical protein
MLILFDHSTPAPLRTYLKEHAVTEARDRGWSKLKTQTKSLCHLLIGNLSACGVPMNHSGDHPDVSRADFTWALIALDFGNGIEATAAELMRVSTKAKTDGERYDYRTALKAHEALQDRVPTISHKTR